MKPETEAAIRNILTNEPELSSEQVEMAFAFLKGTRASPKPDEAILYKDVFRLLKCNRGVLTRYISLGYLERAYSPRRKLAIGITRDSYIRFTTCPKADRHDGNANSVTQPLQGPEREARELA